MKTPESFEKNPSALSSAKFTGTNNPRHLRVLTALLSGPKSREQVDRIAGCSNGPALVLELRDCSLELPCPRISKVARDGNTCVEKWAAADAAPPVPTPRERV